MLRLDRLFDVERWLARVPPRAGDSCPPKNADVYKVEERVKRGLEL